jgi:ethanolamine utilization protein EutM
VATEGHSALGLVETRGLAAAIAAADAMLKAAQVDLLGLETTVAALITVHVSGDTSAVQAAVEAGVQAAARVGDVVGSLVIPRPSSGISELQSLDSPAPVKHSSSRRVDPPSGSLDQLTVRELRTLARNTADLPIKGREIARANKNQLIDALSRAKG